MKSTFLGWLIGVAWCYLIYLVTTKPDALTTGAHCARNASTSLPVSCALADTGIRSFSSRVLRTEGSAVTDLTTSPSMAALSLGMAAAAKKGFQPIGRASWMERGWRYV